MGFKLAELDLVDHSMVMKEIVSHRREWWCLGIKEKKKVGMKMTAEQGDGLHDGR